MDGQAVKVVLSQYSTERSMTSIPQGNTDLSFSASLLMTWRRQWSAAGSSSLQWRSTRAHKSTRTNAKFCSWEGRTRSCDAGWELPG